MLKQSTYSKQLLILREAFTSLLPIVLVMNILVVLSQITLLLEGWGFTAIAAINGNDVSRLYIFLIPLFLNLSLSILLAKEKALEQTGTVLIAMVCYFRATGFLHVSATAEITSQHGSILTSVPCAWLAVSLLHYFSKVPRFKLVHHPKDISPRLAQTINLIVPGVLCVLCFELVGQFFAAIGDTALLETISAALPNLRNMEAIPELILYKVVSLSTWFIGLHGEHSAAGLFRLLNVIEPGDGNSIQLTIFHDVFMNIGGSGATFAIPLIILFSKRSSKFRSIARLSLPFSFFNVNEILLFGLPILLNPVFLIPFLLAPFVNMAIALSAMQLGAFTITAHSTHWMAPPLCSAYVATGGSFAAVVTQLVCIVIDGCIYSPFLIVASRQQQAPLHLLKLLGATAYDLVTEEMNHRQERLFIARQRDLLDTATITQQVIRQLQGGRFILYFQPKFDATSLKICGLEALLRFQNNKGDILLPTFLPVLYEQGLSQVVDTKVVDLAFAQVLQWRAMGLSVPPIAINFDKDFLLDERAVKNFIDRAYQQDVRFCIEITEHTYTVEAEALASTVHQLRAAGHRIAIDDFGSGYSSLTTLLALKPDEIKLDRQLVNVPAGEAKRGTILLATSIQLCHDLGFTVVAEGIETDAQLQLARRCGADVTQGYYLGKPMPSCQVCNLFLNPEDLHRPHSAIQQSYMDKHLSA